MIRRGDIYEANLGEGFGREQGGRRPVLVVSADAVNALPLVVMVIPGTDGRNVSTDYPINVRVSAGEAGLRKETVFLAFQARSIDSRRFVAELWGRLSAERMREVDDALRRVFGLKRA